jgi:hypothetical protein
MSKGGMFKSKAHINMYIKDKKLIKEKKPVREAPKKAPETKEVVKPKKTAPEKPEKKIVKEKK